MYGASAVAAVFGNLDSKTSQAASNGRAAIERAASACSPLLVNRRWRGIKCPALLYRAAYVDRRRGAAAISLTLRQQFSRPCLPAEK